MKSLVTYYRFLGPLALGTILIGCHQDMRDQPRYEALEGSDFFGDGQSARLPVAGTVARGQLQEDEAFYTGKSQGEYVLEPPVEITRELLLHGQERFTIYCSPCHAQTGMGNGMIVERGFRRLGADQRAVLVLHYYVGLSIPALAETLGIPLGTAQSRLGRALAAMRRAIADDLAPVMTAVAAEPST